MSLDAQLNQLLGHLLNDPTEDSIDPKQLITCLDLTLLDEMASTQALAILKKDAQTHLVAAVCVFPKHLHTFATDLPCNLATVINFPQGTGDLSFCLDEITKAKEQGANEIDYVLPYKTYLDGHQKQAIADCSEVASACKNQQLKLKIILETGAFPHMNSLYEVSHALMDVGCDFLKTSTGKTAQGASLSAVFAMLSAIKDAHASCGVKISGGVKTPQQALQFARLAQCINGQPINSDWFRIGASSLLYELRSL